MRPYPALIREKCHITLICGRKGSGKTSLTIKLLRSERGWKNIYDKIIIISPTFLLQPCWGQLDPTGIDVYLDFRTDTICELMALQTENRTSKILLILDDLGEDIVRNKECKPIYHKLIANSRHLNISIIQLHQKISQCPTFVRANADTFISYNSLSGREREALYNEVSTVDKKTFAKIFKDATEVQYSTFCASFIDGQLKLYKDLEEEIYQ